MSLYHPMKPLYGFGAIQEPAAAAATGEAKDTIGAMFGCPNRLGMEALSPTAKFLCYWIKRPMGKVVVVIVLVLLYQMLKKDG